MKKQRFLAVTVGVLVLSVGLVLANYGGGVTPAVAAPADQHAGLPQNWDQIIPAATRFVVLADFAGAAVRDNETGLVWEQTPQPTSQDWDTSRSQCINRIQANKKGWRLPSVAELSSLFNNSTPFLPTGHPFTVTLPNTFWSATTDAGNSTQAWLVAASGAQTNVGNVPKSNSAVMWCVRGGMNADAY